MIDWFLPFLASLMVMIIFMFLSMLFLLKTPAMTFLAASLGGKSVIGIIRRDKVLQFKTNKYESGTLETKGLGTYAVIPDSIYRERKSGVGTMIGNSSVAFTVNPKYYQMANKLKGMGIKNIDEAMQANQDSKINYLQSLGVKVRKNEKGAITGMNATEEELKDADKHGLRVTVNGETVPFDDLYDYQLYNTTPSAMFASIENKVAIERAEERKPDYKWVPLVAVLMVAAAVAIYILYGVFTTPPGGAAPVINIDGQAIADALRNSQPSAPNLGG